MASEPRIEKVNLHETAQERYLNYAMSVITSRALPDVRDGLKPVQRRILYSMYSNLKLDSQSKPRKSAAIVGDVMGKYHPHGDQSIYDAMVRMAQPFSMRQRLVDGHGNFGSLDGDGAAAMRYTEARLTDLAGELLDEIGKNTVDFRDNYDGTEREPTVLPAQVPNLLVNGATGIAVGMATNIPPHNLVECLEALIALIEDRDLTVEDLISDYIQGPDFPTGGVILNTAEELKEIYETGGGTINLRAEWEAENRTTIVIDSVPYTTTKSKIIEKIASHIVKGNLPQVKDVRDESTDEVRIVLELKRGTDHETVMAYLFKHTNLEYRFHVNMTALVPPGAQQSLVQQHDDLAHKLEHLRVDPDEDTGDVPVIELLDYLQDLEVEADPPPVLQPASVNLKEALTYFLDFRMEVYVRSLIYDLEQILGRIHILEAFEIIFDDLDKAIELIRSSASKKEAGQKLRDHFGIDYDQSEAILQTRLYRLARLEIEKIREELSEKRTEARRFKALLTDRELRWEAIKRDFGHLRDLYANLDRGERLTRVDTDNEVLDLEYSEEAYIIDEDVWVMVSKDGWIKRQKSYTDLSTIRCRDNDEIRWVLPGRTPKTVIFFTNMGRAYSMRIDEVPSTTGYGDPLQAFFDFEDGEKVVGVLTDDDRVLQPPPPDQESLDLLEAGEEIPEEDLGPAEVIAITENGRSVRIAIDDYTDPSTVRGRMFMRLEDGDRAVNVEQFTGNQYLVLASRNSRGLIFDAREVNFYKGNAKGVLAIRLSDDDDVLDFTLVPKERKRAGLEVETNNGRKTVIRQTKSKFEPSSRGNKGRLIIKRGHLIRSHRPPLEIEKGEEDEE